MHVVPPLAVDWTELAPIIIGIIYALAQMLFGKKEKELPPAPKRVRPVAPPAPVPVQEFRPPVGNAPQQPAAANNPASLEDMLRREVEQFLKRAQGQAPEPPRQQPRREQPPRRELPARRDQPPQRTRQAPPARSQPAPVSAPAETAARRLVGPADPLSTQQMAAGQVAGGPTVYDQARSPIAQSAPLGAGVGAHVAAHLGGTKILAEHAQQLGTRVAQADNRMEEHLREKFVHQVGRLQHQDTAVERRATGPPAAQLLAQIMAGPGGARQLVLAAEVLRRPEERWIRPSGEA